MPDVLPLLDDGMCSIRAECREDPHSVHARCPQSEKCGTCVAWSPREQNNYGRNSGQCMLDRTARVYLDCNAQICPYYRPRRENPAFAQWEARPKRKSRAARTRRGPQRLDREAPPPSPGALARAAFDDLPTAVADAGAPILEAELSALGKMPVLLERFRGGSARVEGGQLTSAREVSLEAFYARVVLLRRALATLQDALEESGLDDDVKAKVNKDIAGANGSLTTFNVLFAHKEEAFKGTGKG